MSKFSDFIRKATPEEKEAVYAKVIDRAVEVSKTHYADDETLAHIAKLEAENACRDEAIKLLQAELGVAFRRIVSLQTALGRAIDAAQEEGKPR